MQLFEKNFFNAEICDGKADCSDASDERYCSNCTEERTFSCLCNSFKNCSQGYPPCIAEQGKLIKQKLGEILLDIFGLPTGIMTSEPIIDNKSLLFSRIYVEH